MKNYKLLQWYPSLYDDLEVGTVIEYEDGWIYYTNKRGNKTTIEIDEAELSYEDFWELIEEKYCDCNIPIFTLNSTFCRKCLKDIEEKEPLFITEDGVQMFDRDSIVWMVRNKTLEKIKIHSIHLNEYDFEHTVFAHESNADEYIWRNKRVFSYKDIQNYGVHPVNMIRVEQLAKERSENEKK